MSDYYPPCSGRYGRMTERDAIVCCGAPGHRGCHHSRKSGIRWGYENQRAVPCPWKSCTDPMLLVDGVHMCPDGEAEGRYATPPEDPEATD